MSKRNLPPGFELEGSPAALPEGFELETPQQSTAAGPQLENNWRNAVGETALAFGTGAVAMPFAGLAGLATGAARKIGITGAEPADVVRATQEALTYQPRTAAGQKVTRAVGLPFELLAKGADWAGGKTTDITGSPALGAGVNTAIQMAPALLFKRSKPGAPSAASEGAARAWVGSNTGLDWAALPDSFRKTLSGIAADSRNLSRLDPAAVERAARFETLKAPATAGQITRDPVALRREGLVSATEEGRPIYDIHQRQNQAIVDRLREFGPKRATGEVTPEGRGRVVQDAARAKLNLTERQVSDLYKKADEAGETAVQIDVAPILDRIRGTPDRTHYRWAESWIRQMTKKEKGGKPATLQSRNTSRPAPAEDSALQFLAKSNRGLSLDEAMAQGLDKADFSLPAARVGGKRAFRQGGMSFDEAAQMLDEAGYPVRDARGNYDPNVLLDVLDGELRGRPAYSTQNTRLIAEAETARLDVQRLADKAREIDPEFTERLLESQADDAFIASELRRMMGNDKPPIRLSVRELEDLRKAAVARAKDGGTAGHYAGQLIRAIDEATEGAGGKLYQQARAARKAQAMEFQEQAGVARLVENKSRTDPAVPLEQTWRRTVIGGSIDDLARVKKSMLTGGDATTRTAGKQGWRAIQEQTADSIIKEATRGVQPYPDGTPNVTPAALKRAADQIGAAKFDMIFGPGKWAKLQEIVKATVDLKTEPPAGFKGSPTVPNALVMFESWIGKIPLVGNVAAGTIQAGVKLNALGRTGRDVRTATSNPLTATAENTLRRQATRRNALVATGLTAEETARNSR
jgi:hypothetical protein